MGVDKEPSLEEFYAYGFSQYKANHWKEAIDAFRLLCTRRPLESRFWFSLASAIQASGNYSEALHSWAMAALLNKEDPYPHFHAAECYFSLENLKEALLALNEVELRTAENHPLQEKAQLLKELWKI